MFRLARFAFVLALVALCTSACAGGGNPVQPGGTTPPVVDPPITGGTYYGPPTGIDQKDWELAFRKNGTLGYPEGWLVHFVLPVGMDEDTRRVVSGHVEKLNGLGLQARFDFAPGGTGANIPVSVVPGLQCAGKSVAACTTFAYDTSGRLVGQKVEFASLSVMRDQTNFLKEAIRCLGIERNSSKPGLLAESATGTAPTAEELAVLIAREKLPLLARCGKDAYTPCD